MKPEPFEYVDYEGEGEIHCYSGIILSTNNLVLWQNNITSILVAIMG